MTSISFASLCFLTSTCCVNQADLIDLGMGAGGGGGDDDSDDEDEDVRLSPVFICTHTLGFDLNY